jgi:hypothetical protein
MGVVLDYLNLAFWSTTFMLFKVFIKIIHLLTPRSFIKNIITKDLESTGMKVTFNKAEIGKYDKTKYTVELVVNDDRFFKRIFDTSLGIAESYAVRHITKEKDIDKTTLHNSNRESISH